MSALQNIQTHLAPAWRANADRRAISKAAVSAPIKPPLWRRIVAGLIDRAAPLPFIAYFFPAWTLVVLAYHLLCDASPHRRSFGKLICRLRVVEASSVAPCRWHGSILRRFGLAISQVAWCVPEMMLWALVYDLASFAWVLLSPKGRRAEDLIAGTVVVTEAAYRKRMRNARPELVRNHQSPTAYHPCKLGGEDHA
jgi:uncharacterized RDD family membrane protein YckC